MAITLPAPPPYPLSHSLAPLSRGLTENGKLPTEDGNQINFTPDDVSNREVDDYYLPKATLV
jgi:hypothetical protein